MKITLKQILRLSLIGIILPLIIGCSKELSRDEAEKQIKQKYQLPKEELKAFNSREDGGDALYYHWLKSNEDHYERNRRLGKPQMFSFLENEGFITVNNVAEQYRANRD